MSFSHPSTTKNLTNPNFSYKNTFTRESLNHPCLSVSKHNQTSNCFNPSLNRQLYNENQLKTNFNQNILGFPKAFLKNLDHATSLKLIQAYEKLGRTIPLAVSGKYGQVVENMKSMITTLCQTASTQHGNSSTSFTTK
jgi:hypothetical protein